jgi:hypothetical protein
MLQRKLWAVALGAILSALFVGAPALAEPHAPAAAQPSFMIKPVGSLTPAEFRLRVEAPIKRQTVRPLVAGGPEAIPFLSADNNQVAWTGVTTGWSRGTIKIFGILYRPNNTKAGDDGATCLNSSACTFPTHWTDCTCVHGTWQLYVDGEGPGGAVGARADLVT